MKNHSITIKNKKDRTLTAKGNKFVWKCIDVLASQRGLNRYSPEMSTLKEQFMSQVKHLLIDKEMKLDEIKSLIRDSVNNPLPVVENELNYFGVNEKKHSPICGKGRTIAVSGSYNERHYKDSHVKVAVGHHNSPVSISFARSYKSGREVSGSCTLSWSQTEELLNHLQEVLKYRENFEKK